MPRLRGRLVATAVTVAVTLGLGSMSTGTATAATGPNAPASGPVRSTASSSCRPGDVLDDRPSAFPGGGASSVRRILYCSVDIDGRPTAVSGTVLVPDRPWSGPGARPVVSYAVGTHGLGDRCAPSTAIAAGSEGEGSVLTALLGAGFVVAVTDYPGLGTPGPHPYVIREPTGHAVLDAARAAGRLGAGGASAAGPVVIEGFSQGGGAAGAAAEQQPTYAPEMHLKGVAAGGIPADLPAIARAIEPTSNAVLQLFVAHGLEAAYPRAGIESVFNAAGRALMAKLADACVGDLLKYSSVRTATLTRDGRPLSADLIGRFGALLQAQAIGDGTPRVPILGSHSRFDDLLPFDQGRRPAVAWCGRGVTVQFDTSVVPTHTLSGFAANLRAVSWLSDRIADKPAPNNCGSF